MSNGTYFNPEEVYPAALALQDIPLSKVLSAASHGLIEGAPGTGKSQELGRKMAMWGNIAEMVNEAFQLWHSGFLNKRIFPSTVEAGQAETVDENAREQGDST